MLNVYKKNLTTFADLDMELFTVTEILKLKSLHYGYWQPEEPLTFENLKLAQARYTETLLSLVPPEVKTVLDVGAGTGDNALALCDRGCNVVAISPDRNHARYFAALESPHLRFIPTRFEDYREPDRFDLVLMSESQGYFKTDIGLAQCRRLVKPGGYVLVSGIFRRNDDQPPARGKNYYDFDTEMHYKTRAGIYGLHLIKEIDITRESVPTLALAFGIYRERLLPLLAMMKHYLNSSTGWKWQFFKILMQKQFREMKAIKQMYDERLDPEFFQKRAVYLRMLFRMPF